VVGGGLLLHNFEVVRLVGKDDQMLFKCNDAFYTLHFKEAVMLKRYKIA
jgi:hypothetical protein